MKREECIRDSVTIGWSRLSLVSANLGVCGLELEA
jgi:hypothetical protein